MSFEFEEPLELPAVATETAATVEEVGGETVAGEVLAGEEVAVGGSTIMEGAGIGAGLAEACSGPVGWLALAEEATAGVLLYAYKVDVEAACIEEWAAQPSQLAAHPHQVRKIYEGSIRCWNTSQPVDALDNNGKYPSWQTVQRRYWLKYTGSQEPPRRADILDPRSGKGVAKELHHINGRTGPRPHRDENLIEVWPWEHSEIDPDRRYRGPRP
jgi:hypothetical protein